MPLTHSVHVGAAVSAKIDRISAVQLTGRGPGEVSGPGVAVGVTVTNISHKTVDLSAASVTVFDSNGRPCPMITGSPTDPFAGSLAVGAHASAVYAFTVSTTHRTPLTVHFSYTPHAPVVVFTGSAG